MLFSAPFFVASALTLDLNRDSLDQFNRIQWAGFPIVYYQPETRWGFGAAGAINFRWKNQDRHQKPSQLKMAFSFTQEKQILAYLPFSIYTTNEKWWFDGQLAFYKYFYRFYGLGNNTTKDEEEIYRTDFPRLRFKVYRAVGTQWYVGLSYAYDRLQISDLDESGKLITGDIVGSKGGVVSMPGVSLVYDSRDLLFYPSEGWYSRADIQFASKITGSDHEFIKTTLELANYQTTGPKSILATGLFFQSSTGNPPFYQLAMLGGSRWIRSYIDGKYRDEVFMAIQSEFRHKLHPLLGVTIFTGLGDVAGPHSQSFMNKPKWSVGGGLRLTADPENQLHIRLDFSLGRDGTAFYLTVGEAF